MRLKQIIGGILLVTFIGYLGFKVADQSKSKDDQLLMIFFFGIVGLIIIWAVNRILNQ